MLPASVVSQSAGTVTGVDVVGYSSNPSTTPGFALLGDDVDVVFHGVTDTTPATTNEAAAASEAAATTAPLEAAPASADEAVVTTSEAPEAAGETAAGDSNG